MNYEDELERSRARKSRRRESTVHERESRGSSADLWSATAEPGSRASRSRAASAGPGHSSHGSHGHNSHRRRKNSQKKKIIIGVLVGILALGALFYFGGMQIHPESVGLTLVLRTLLLLVYIGLAGYLFTPVFAQLRHRRK